MTAPLPPPASVTKTAVWPIRIISLLLALQGLGLLTLSLLWLAQGDWLQQPLQLPRPDPIGERWVLGLLLAPVALLLVLSAVGFLLLQRAAWLAAMLAQGFILSNGLSNYFAEGATLRQSHLLYAMLFSAIVLVLYLNTNDVRHAFTLRSPLLETPPLSEGEFERIEISRPPPRVESLDESEPR